MESWINSMTLRESTMFVYTQNFNQNCHSSCKHYWDCNLQPFGRLCMHKEDCFSYTKFTHNGHCFVKTAPSNGC